jgi:O-antigen/teichoic acid export membrane protein
MRQRLPREPAKNIVTEPSETPLRTRVAHSIFWLTWSRGAVQLLSFVTTVLVARILDPADYGIMALASVFIAISGMLSELGLGTAVVQFRDLERAELNTCFWITMTLATIACVILALGAPVIADWFAVPRLADVLPFLALALPLTACSTVSDSLLRKRLALNRVSQAEIIRGLVTLPVMLYCAYNGFGVWTLVIGFLMGEIVRSVAIFAFAPWLPGLRIGGARAREMLQFSLKTLAITILWALQEQADVPVIGKITGQAAVGLYSMAKHLAMLPTTKISSVVYMLSSPMMAELQTDIAAMRRAFFRAVRLTWAITLPASAGMALVAKPMVYVLLGDKWSQAVPVLQLLCLYAAARAIDVLLPPVLVARRRQRFLICYYLALLLGVSAAAALGALWDGASGAVKLFSPLYCGLMIIMTREVLVELHGSFWDIWSETWPIVAATVAMGAAVLLLRQIMFSGRTEPQFLELILLSVTGVVTYLGALFAFGRTMIGEGAEVVGWILPILLPTLTRIRKHCYRLD